MNKCSGLSNQALASTRPFGMRWDQEIDKDHGNLVVVDHLLSLLRISKVQIRSTYSWGEATKLFSQGLFELVHC